MIVNYKSTWKKKTNLTIYKVLQCPGVYRISTPGAYRNKVRYYVIGCRIFQYLNNYALAPCSFICEYEDYDGNGFLDTRIEYDLFTYLKPLPPRLPRELRNLQITSDIYKD